MATFKYAKYPSAHVYNDDDEQVKHLLWGDWVRIEGAKQSGWYPVRARGVSGWMHEDDLQDERLLEIVFVDVGQGDGCLVVTPQDEHIVIDAGVSDNMFRFLKWRYAGFKRKWTFKAGVMTHPDMDHYAGFDPLFEHENVHFDTLYHNGIMEQKGHTGGLGHRKKIDGVWHLDDLIRTKSALRTFFQNESRWKRKKYPTLVKTALDSGRVKDIRMLSVNHCDSGFMPGFTDSREVRLRVLGPIERKDSSGKWCLRAFGSDPKSKAFNKGKTKNGHSVVLMLEYRDAKFLLGGDLNKPAEAHLLAHYSGLNHEYPWTSAQEDELVEAARNTFQADVAKSCHHGSADVTDAMLRSVYAAATVISSGDEESHAHPRCDTLGAIGLYGRGTRPLIFSTELMRSTRENEDHLTRHVDDLRMQFGTAQTPDEQAAIEIALNTTLDMLMKRNVTVYGSINLRTDGRKIVMAYKLEQKRHGSGRITEWDIYPLEKAGDGPFRYAPSGGH